MMSTLSRRWSKRLAGTDLKILRVLAPDSERPNYGAEVQSSVHGPGEIHTMLDLL